MFVRREKDGRAGYLVLAPFVTAKRNVSHNVEAEQYDFSQLMVNLGWVPQEHANQVGMSTEPLGTYEQVDEEEAMGFSYDLYTGTSVLE